MAVAAGRLRLVGRAREVAELEGELRRAQGGALRCVLLLADPGVGKTRLASELLTRARGSVIALSARAYPLGATASLGLWVEAFERYLAGLPPAEVRSLCGGVLDDLAGVLRSVTAVRGRAPEHETPHMRLLQAFAVLLRNLTQKGPVVLVLDDVHLADASSWEALGYLARNLSDCRLLIVSAARPVELGQQPDAMETVLGLQQDGLLRKVTLTPIDRQGVDDLARGILDADPPPTLVDWLFERSRGYPLFAIGLLRTLHESGSDLTAPALDRVPEDLSGRVMNRLKLLDEPERATLEMLAVVGRRVELHELLTLTSRPLDRLAPILEKLVRLRLVTEEERGHELIYEVAHPLIQEAIYQAIGGARRRALHRLVARAFTASGQRAAAASHYVRCAATGEDEATDALIDALRQAEERESHREAMPILGALLDLLPATDRRWLRVLDTMSWDAEWVFDHQADLYSEIGTRAMRRIEPLVPASDVARQAFVQLRLTSFRVWLLDELEDAMRTARASRELFLHAGDERRSLIALHELGWLQSVSGGLAAQERTAREVITQGESLGDRVLVSHGLGSLAWAAFQRGRFADAESALRTGARIAAEDGRHYRLAWSLSSLAYSLALEGRLSEAQPLLRESRAASASYADTVLFGITAFVQWLAGDFRAGLAVWSESEEWNAGRLSARRGWGMIYAALSAPELGRIQEAVRYLALARRVFGERPAGFAYNNCDWLAGLIARAKEDLSGALANLRRAASSLIAIQALPVAAFVLVELIEVAAELDARGHASEAASELEQIAGAIDRRLYQALAALGAAWAHLLAHDGRAVETARRAVDLLEGTECAQFRARALDVLGRSLASTDPQAAATALAQAASFFGESGAVRRRERCLEAVRALGHAGRRAAAVTGSAALTPREREVTRLALEGLSAKEIGRRLVIGERTVETHLANAYAKLGVTSRVELVRKAPELSTEPR